MSPNRKRQPAGSAWPPSRHRTGPRRRPPAPTAGRGSAGSPSARGVGWQHRKPARADQGSPAFGAEVLLDNRRAALGGMDHSERRGHDANVMWSPALFGEEEEVAGFGLGCPERDAGVV